MKTSSSGRAGVANCKLQNEERAARGRLFRTAVYPLQFAICIFQFSICNLLSAADSAPSLSAKQASQYESLLAQVQDLARRVRQLDADNRDLTSRLALELQERKLMADQLDAARQRLTEAGVQVRGLQTAWQTSQQSLAQATRKAADLEAQMKRQAVERPAPRVGAVLTANNSVKKSLPLPELPGIEVRQENELIRIELPSDRLFAPGGADLQPEAFALLDQVAAAIARSYPRQIVGIEGYWDSTPIGAAEQGAAGAPSAFKSAHQLTGSQALTLFDQLTSRNRLPSRQLYIMGQGSNYPRVSNATPAGQAKNRRIEFVIYPETYDGL